MLRKHLPGLEDEYILSYVSFTHGTHALIAISKKVGEEYVIVNTIGLMEQWDKKTYAQRAEHSEIRAAHELINPGRDQISVYAKHYKIRNEQAMNVFNFISKQNNRIFSFSTFTNNCHHFAMSLLSFLGINDKELTKQRFPITHKKTLNQLTRKTVPEELHKQKIDECFTFYGSDNKTAKGKDVASDTLNTWYWSKNISINNTTEYKPNPAYFKTINKTPAIHKEEAEEKIKLKKAVYLLTDYCNGNKLFHPNRTYRNLVQNVLNDLREEDTVSSLVQNIRQSVLNHHCKNGETACVKGSLNQRLLFIDFVLNTKNVINSDPLHFSQSHINTDAESLLFSALHCDVDPFYSSIIADRQYMSFKAEINKHKDVLNYSKQLYAENKLQFADFFDVVNACNIENKNANFVPNIQGLIINILQNEMWDKQSGLFRKHVPEGIMQMRELSHYGLKKLIDITKKREKTLKFKFLEGTGFRNQKLTEFYLLLTSLEKLTEPQAFVAISTFCSKWNVRDSSTKLLLASSNHEDIECKQAKVNA